MMQRQEAHLTDLRAALQRSIAKQTQLQEAAAIAHRLHEEASAGASAPAAVTALAAEAGTDGVLAAAPCNDARRGVTVAVAERREQHKQQRQELQRKLQLARASREALMGRCRRLEASLKVQQRGLEEAAARRAAAARDFKEAEQGGGALKRQVAEAQSAVEAASSAAQAAQGRKRAVAKEAENALSLLLAAATARAEGERHHAAARTAVSELEVSVIQHRHLVATAADDLATAKVAAAAAEGHGHGAEGVVAVGGVAAATAPAADSDGTGEGSRGAGCSGNRALGVMDEDADQKVLEKRLQSRQTGDAKISSRCGGTRAARSYANVQQGDSESEAADSDGGESSESDDSRNFVSPSARGRRVSSSRCTAAATAAARNRHSSGCRRRRRGGLGGGTSKCTEMANGGGSGEEGGSDGSREDEWLSAEAEAVAAAERGLEAERGQIDAAALQEDVSLLRDLCCCVTAGLDEQLEAAAAKREALQATRYSRLAAALADVNRQLGCVYCTLTAGAGDAVLSYIPDRTLLFAHGVSLEVRPWRRRPFTSTMRLTVRSTRPPPRGWLTTCAVPRNPLGLSAPLSPGIQQKPRGEAARGA
ncbi:hypothetical protein Vafri_12670 [Volvox africanus]|uniref:Uncharacterized protein n=1 Tax=Volvox africanus TaxID=51714 RepID=A0A8J4BAN6_9CHLO|nr:hypothetical protein Vafri_12670 [Volvox africanus]